MLTLEQALAEPPLPPLIHYPDSDGKPMGENDEQWQWIMKIIANLMTIFYDTHAHLDFPDFETEIPAVIDRARRAGIERVVCIGTDEASNRRVVAMAEQNSSLYACVGWHPDQASAAPADVRPVLRSLAQHPKVVAIGETGLDFHRLPRETEGGAAAENDRVRQRQREVFRQQLELAAELGLNCVVHQRAAVDETLEEVAAFAGRLQAVFHCFVDEAAVMRRVLALGGRVSFTGILTFKNAAEVRETLAETPLDAFMLETDSPYLAPVPYRGKRAEPAHVKEIAEVAAQVKHCSLDTLSRATCATAEAFFFGARRKPGPSDVGARDPSS